MQGAAVCNWGRYRKLRCKGDRTAWIFGWWHCAVPEMLSTCVIRPYLARPTCRMIWRGPRLCWRGAAWTVWILAGTILPRGPRLLLRSRTCSDVLVAGVPCTVPAASNIQASMASKIESHYRRLKTLRGVLAGDASEL